MKYLFFFLHQQKLETDCIQDLMNHAVHAQKSLAPALRQVGTSKGITFDCCILLSIDVLFYCVFRKICHRFKYIAKYHAYMYANWYGQKCSDTNLCSPVKKLNYSQISFLQDFSIVSILCTAGFDVLPSAEEEKWSGCHVVKSVRAISLEVSKGLYIAVIY